jgi:hypothetical protein
MKTSTSDTRERQISSSSRFICEIDSSIFARDFSLHFLRLDNCTRIPCLSRIFDDNSRLFSLHLIDAGFIGPCISQLANSETVFSRTKRVNPA